MSKLKIISVDFQKDFSAKNGASYKTRKSVGFIKETFVPFLRKNKIKIAEIISDYRQARLGDRENLCCPGKSGYESEIPPDVKLKNVWVKCENSPIWTRKNIGVATKEPGLPYQDPIAFTKWLNSNIGKYNEVDEIILIGLTLDCCILSCAQELDWRGYKVKILKEATDTYSGNQKEKEWILNHVPLHNWAKVISWKEFQNYRESR